MSRRTPQGIRTIRPFLLLAAVGAAIVLITQLQPSGAGNPALATSSGIDNIATFLEQCPTNDPAYHQIRTDFQIRREGVIVNALSCTEPISAMADAQFLDELIAVQALRTIYYMDGGRSVPYPWTGGTLYDWMKSKIGGIDIRASGSNCCASYDGKWFVMIQSQSAFDRGRDKQWRGLSQNIALLGHEVRHVDGFPHVGGCPLFPNVTYGCDPTYDPVNLSPYGIQWWLNARWLSGEINVGFGCLSTAITIASLHLSAANNDYRQRFVTGPPPLLTMPPQPGGPCPGASPAASPTPTPLPSPSPTPTPLPSPSPTPVTTPPPSPGPTSPTPSATPRPVLQGDVDCSGRVTALDATALLRFSTLRPYTQNEPCPDIGTSIGRIWGDVDCNRQANSLDGVKVLWHMFGQPVTQFEPCPDIGKQFR